MTDTTQAAQRIATSLRRLRLARGLTQDVVCETTALQQRTLRHLETRCAGTVDSLLRLAVVLSIADKLQELFERCAADAVLVNPGADRELLPSIYAAQRQAPG